MIGQDLPEVGFGPGHAVRILEVPSDREDGIRRCDGFRRTAAKPLDHVPVALDDGDALLIADASKSREGLPVEPLGLLDVSERERDVGEAVRGSRLPVRIAGRREQRRGRLDRRLLFVQPSQGIQGVGPSEPALRGELSGTALPCAPHGPIGRRDDTVPVRRVLPRSRLRVVDPRIGSERSREAAADPGEEANRLLRVPGEGEVLSEAQAVLEVVGKEVVQGTKGLHRLVRLVVDFVEPSLEIETLLPRHPSVEVDGLLASSRARAWYPRPLHAIERTWCARAKSGFPRDGPLQKWPRPGRVGQPLAFEPSGVEPGRLRVPGQGGRDDGLFGGRRNLQPHLASEPGSQRSDELEEIAFHAGRRCRPDRLAGPGVLHDDVEP